MSSERRIELKECPFCGSNNIVMIAGGTLKEDISRAVVECSSCLARGREVLFHDKIYFSNTRNEEQEGKVNKGKQEAIQAWNKRTPSMGEE